MPIYNNVYNEKSKVYITSNAAAFLFVVALCD